jgi:hypothetical protein
LDGVTVMVTALCNPLNTLTRHRACCRIPQWTAYLEQRWDTHDVGPWNLYNLWWRFRAWVTSHER